MKLPEDVRQFLARRFQSKHREWLIGDQGESQWPLEVPLSIPTEQAALRQVDGVRAWVSAWQGWQGVGTLSWCERRWKALGVQRLPEKLALRDPEDVALWIGESVRWERAQSRYQTLTARWPILAQQLPRYFDVLADYSDADFRRLAEMLEWIRTIRIPTSTPDKFRLLVPTANGWNRARGLSLIWLRRFRVIQQGSATSLGAAV